MLLLGVDGGGTRTYVWLMTDGSIVRAALAAPGSNIVSLGFDAGLAVLDEAIAAALAEAGEPASAVDAAVLGLAGASGSGEQRTIENWLGRLLPGRPVRVVTDVELVLAAGTPAGEGLAIVSGTGSIVLARGRDERIARVGGWGPAIGDPGSGHAIGTEALRAVALDVDGIGPASGLAEAIMAATGAGDAAGLRAAAVSPAAIAALVPVVASAAARGNETAIAILDAAGRALADQAAAACRRLAWEAAEIPCALGGGVLVHVERVRAALLVEAARRGLRLLPVALVEQPVRGAIVLASELRCAAPAS